MTKFGISSYPPGEDGLPLTVPTGCQCVPAPRSRKLRRGAAAVEFAIVLPVLTAVLLGATDFARFSYATVAVTNAARSGAQYGIMNPVDSSNQDVWKSAVKQAAIDEMATSSAFDTSKLTVEITTTNEAGGLRRVSVQATYPYTTTVNWSYFPHTVSLSQTVVMRGIR
jgi:Flp pilus assembly protein TadG